MIHLNSKNQSIRVLDLFCGGGGFSEGFHQAGYDVVAGIDNWKPACETHEINGLGASLNIDMLDVGLDDVIDIKNQLESDFGTVDIVIGSPPCTEFSFAKKGGRGDIESGMILVKKHLLFVSVFKPKYWLMENVPRLEQVLDKECDGSRKNGWKIAYSKLGIPEDRFGELGLEGEYLHIPKGSVLTASDFGTAEDRTRFIAGNFPLELIKKFKVNKDISLNNIISKLKYGFTKANSEELVEDPNYPGHFVNKSDIRDYNYDTTFHPMYWEEMRHSKRRHIQYGRMNFPENLASPSRTIMATCNSSSRESLTFDTGEKITYHLKERPLYRQPNVREVACIQGFPLDFQLVANNINDRYKLIGNAVPCQLSYALAKSISMDINQKLSDFEDSDFYFRASETISRQQKNDYRPIVSKPKIIVPEADNIKDIHKEFKANPLKHLRRKLLSSKMEQDSAVLIFENSELVEGKVKGGNVWKCCIQKGVGKKYNKVYIDERSINCILKNLDCTLNTDELKTIVKDLLNEADKGIPLVSPEWEEFRNLNGNVDEYLSLITNERKEIPSVSFFQKCFTQDIPDIGKYISPIDFFDGLDAIMLTVFKKYPDLKDTKIKVHILDDKGPIYLARKDNEIPNLNGIEIPLITLMAGFVSCYILKSMYDSNEEEMSGFYSSSLSSAIEELLKWSFA